MVSCEATASADKVGSYSLERRRGRLLAVAVCHTACSRAHLCILSRRQAVRAAKAVLASRAEWRPTLASAPRPPDRACRIFLGSSARSDHCQATRPSVGDRVANSASSCTPAMKRAASWSLGAALALLSLFPPLTTTARNYSICEEWVGHDFLDQFFFWDYTDPTQGKVDYVNQGTAKKLNLTYVNPVTNQFVMQVDTDHDAVSLNGNKSDLGRRSVRLHSNRAYGDGVYILKASWIPQGCGYVASSDQVHGLPFGHPRRTTGRTAGKSTSWKASTAWTPTSPVCTPRAHAMSPPMSPRPSKAHCSRATVQTSQAAPRASIILRRSAQGSTKSRCADLRSGGGYFALMRDTQVGGRGVRTASNPDRGVVLADEFECVCYPGRGGCRDGTRARHDRYRGSPAALGQATGVLRLGYGPRRQLRTEPAVFEPRDHF